MRINRKQRRSAERSEPGADEVVDDDTADQLDDGDDVRSARASVSGRDAADLDDLDPADLDDDGLAMNQDLDDDAPVRARGRRSGDTMVGAPVARPRPPQSGAGPSRTTPRQFLHEVNVELRKVAWPTRRETINYSSVVFVTLAVLMALIFGLDYGFNRLSLYLFK